MDKHKVIEAYRRGLITLQECSQILGADSSQLDDLVSLGTFRRLESKDGFIIADKR